MTRIDFYILPDSELTARYQFCCKLISKTFKMNHRILVLCENEDAVNTLNDMLWTFKSSAFIPHSVLNADQDNADADIVLMAGDSLGEPPAQHHDLLINMAGIIPAWFSHFERVSEIVVQQAQVLETTRANYRQFADKNYPLHRHDMR